MSHNAILHIVSKLACPLLFVAAGTIVAFAQGAAPPEVVKEIAPTGKLRAAINLGNAVLAQKGADGPKGVSVDLASGQALQPDRETVFLRVVNVGEPCGLEQGCGHILRRDTDATALSRGRQPERRYLGRRLRKGAAEVARGGFSRAACRRLTSRRAQYGDAWLTTGRRQPQQVTSHALVLRAAVGVWHASSSCRMGASTDPLAVTDNQGRVYGVPALRIVDASVIPVIPSANVHLTVLMLAEKIADDILAQH